MDPALLDLVRLRIAQIHHYKVGVEKHRLDLKARGESEERLDQLKAWHESSLFSDCEKAALALGESISLDPIESLPKQLVQEARRHFNKEQMISLLVAIMAINDWNYLTAHNKVKKISQSHISPTSTPVLIFKIPRLIQGA